MAELLVPFRQFVLKVHGRCDLACNHCYVFQHADKSWRVKPKNIRLSTVEQAALRIAEHAQAHRLDRAHVIIHGGEPLLVGAARLKQFSETLRSSVDQVCALDLRIHTNGLLLDNRMCEALSSQNIKVGISLDGDREANDRHRRYADGRSSYERVVRAIDRLNKEQYRHLYAGLLCTIDVDNDPVAVYKTLVSFDPPDIDFLLPHATWDKPPARVGSAPVYANWLIAIFEEWNATGRPVRIRLFDSIIDTTFGYPSRTEAVGLERADLVVIDTDGCYEQSDALKIAFDGAAGTGLNVFEHTLDEAAMHPGIQARQLGRKGLCRTCATCPVVTSCGGGLYAHRYKRVTGFRNPSVYCADLKRLITHIQGRITPSRAAGGAHRPGHGIPCAEFDMLAAGFGNDQSIAHLVKAQRSLARGLLETVHEMAESGCGGRRDSDASAAWARLTAIDRQDRSAVDRVLAHPYVRVWAARCIDRLRGGGPGGRVAIGEPSLASEVGHLGGMAIAAAVYADIDAQLVVPVRKGAVHFPTLGRLMVGAGSSEAEVHTINGMLTVKAQGRRWVVRAKPATAESVGEHSTADWQPVRHLDSQGFRVALEDTDPYRDCHQWDASPRVGESEFRRWDEQFARAWRVIGDRHAPYASGLMAGLKLIMPLQPRAGLENLSSAARQASGAVAVALPEDHVTLALLLIHEFQHVKLGAILDLYDLYDVEDKRLFQAPWRPDLRPLGALLQGTYAHVAVTNFWAAERRHGGGSSGQAAQANYVLFREWTAEALRTVTGSGSLTPLGKRFVDGMQDSFMLC